MQRERFKRTGQEPKFGFIKRVFDKTKFLFHSPTELSRNSFWNSGFMTVKGLGFTGLGCNQREIHSLLIRTLEYFLPFIRLVYSRRNCYGWNLQYNYQMQVRCAHSTVKYKWNSQLHSSVGRASHRCRKSHGLESCWNPDIFRASSFQFTFSSFLRKSSSTYFEINFLECSLLCSRYSGGRGTLFPNSVSKTHGVTGCGGVEFAGAFNFTVDDI